MGERLRQLRTDRGLTVKEVAASLDMTLGAYAHYEQGIREPSISILKRICDFFDVSADYIIGRTDSY